MCTGFGKLGVSEMPRVTRVRGSTGHHMYVWEMLAPGGLRQRCGFRDRDRFNPQPENSTPTPKP